MSGYDYLSLIKRHAKKRSKKDFIKLRAAQELIALEGGFQHFHELRKVALNHPNDIRLMRVAFQTDDITQVLYADEIYDRLNSWLEEELSSQLAETNAYGFYIDELDVSNVNYDESTGVLSVEANISYAGDQDPDRPYSGRAFNVEVVVQLFQRSLHWELLDTEDALQIIEVESDQDSDWKQQHIDADIFNSGKLNDAIKASKLFGDSTRLNKAVEDATRLTGAIPDFAKQTRAITDIEKLTRTIPDVTSTIDKLRKLGLI